MDLFKVDKTVEEPDNFVRGIDKFWVETVIEHMATDDVQHCFQFRTDVLS